jgi:pimeloyl-ACP methyl ester carboxylesterase
MAPWIEGDLTANGIRLHYYRTGSGSKPALVLSHGITDYGLNWAVLARALESDYDVVMYDARGHGRSDAPPSGYSPQDHAADLLGLIEALGLRRPALLGHSMGATDIAAAVALAPEVPSCVLLEDPPWRPQAAAPAENRAFAENWRADVVRMKASSREELLDRIRTQAPRWSDEERERWADAKLQLDPLVLDFVTAPPFDWRAALPHITCPLLLITADTEAGAIVGPELAQEVVQLAPRARVVHIPGAGHSIRREQFDAYVAAVRSFLQEYTRP